MSEVIQLFSGGKDSFLSTCKLVEEGYKVNLIFYENGCGLKGNNIDHGVNRLIKKYGDKVNYIGKRNVSAIWRELIYEYFNMTPSEIIQEYGEVPISQFNCLTCRVSMYIYSIIVAKQLNIKYISDGARRDQLFVIEQDVMINKFEKLFEDNDLKLILPVYNLNSDWEEKNELLIRGFNPKVLEPQCLLGIPMKSNNISSEEIMGTVNVYDKLIKNKIQDIIKRYMNVNLNRGEII